MQQRNVSWIELFFDLIFVSAAHQLSLLLSNATSFKHAMLLMLLFIPILWCWFSHTLFTSQFADRSWFYHVTTFVQIIGVVTLVILMPTATTIHQTYFAYAYVLFKAFLIAQYILWSILEIHRLLHMIPVVIGNIGSGVLWFLSTMSDHPYIWWALAMTIDILTPVFTKTKDLAQNINPHHLPERFGMLTIIVLGEMMLSFIISSMGVPISKDLISVLAAGILIATMIFWTYFRYIDYAILGFSKSTSRVYIYSHLPLVLGIICIASAYKAIMRGASGEWLLVFGIILFTLAFRVLRFIQDQRLLKRQIICIFLLLPILGWFYFFSSDALLFNTAILTGCFAVYLLISEFFLGWIIQQSPANMPATGRIQWDK
ncbi:MAG TPA: low temperature requirement protein A [Acidobacteriota bacterium]|nr:low temperature requirement protein A [Acidobacteriota bacterium]